VSGGVPKDIVQESTDLPPKKEAIMPKGQEKKAVNNKPKLSIKEKKEKKKAKEAAKQ